MQVLTELLEACLAGLAKHSIRLEAVIVHWISSYRKAKVQHEIVEKVLEKELGVSGTKSYLGYRLPLGAGASHLGLQFPHL